MDIAINNNLLWVIGATFAALTVGTGVRIVALRKSTADVARKRIGSLKVWWTLAILWSIAAVFGIVGTTVLLSVASLLAMREFLRLVDEPPVIGRAALACLTLCGAGHYLLIATGHSDVSFWFLPIALLITTAAIRASTKSPNDYLRITAAIYWGGMLMVYALSHALYLFELDRPTEEPAIMPVVGSVGWFLFVLLITEMNDIMQAIVGRRLGRHRITPVVSPNKTLEGLIGGMLTSITLALTLGPWLTTLTVDRTPIAAAGLLVLTGVLISLTGFLGDINMSAIKRDAGVKDGSTLLPGMGGVIDRIDSLTFTAPAFYYFVLLTRLWD